MPPLPAGFTVKASRYVMIARAPRTRKAFLVAGKPARLVPIIVRSEFHTWADFEKAIPL